MNAPLLTSMHWGVYEVEVEGGRVVAERSGLATVDAVELERQLDRLRQIAERKVVRTSWLGREDGPHVVERFADDLPKEYGLAESGIPGAAEAARALRDEAP